MSNQETILSIKEKVAALPYDGEPLSAWLSSFYRVVPEVIGLDEAFSSDLILARLQKEEPYKEQDYTLETISDLESSEFKMQEAAAILRSKSVKLVRRLWEMRAKIEEGISRNTATIGSLETSLLSMMQGYSQFQDKDAPPQKSDMIETLIEQNRAAISQLRQENADGRAWIEELTTRVPEEIEDILVRKTPNVGRFSRSKEDRKAFVRWYSCGRHQTSFDSIAWKSQIKPVKYFKVVSRAGKLTLECLHELPEHLQGNPIPPLNEISFEALTSQFKNPPNDDKAEVAYFELSEYSRQLGGPQSEPIVHFRYPCFEEKKTWTFLTLEAHEHVFDVQIQVRNGELKGVMVGIASMGQDC